MADHKAYCNCTTCQTAKAVLNRGKAKRVLPRHLISQIIEKALNKKKKCFGRA